MLLDLMAAGSGLPQGLIVGMLAAVGGGAVAALIGGLFLRPKNRAETAKLVAEEGRTIDQRWKDWADELEGRLEHERAEHEGELNEIRDRLSGVEIELRDKNLALDKEIKARRRLEGDLHHQRRATRAILSWALTMRDEVRRLHGESPDLPRQVESYLNELDERT